MARAVSRLVLDTSALLFWTLAPERLSVRARGAIEAAAPFGRLASAISLWEIGLKVRRNQLSLGVSFAEYVQRLQLVDGLVLAPASCQLLVDLMLGREPIVDPAPYAPSRRLGAV